MENTTQRPSKFSEKRVARQEYRDIDFLCDDGKIESVFYHYVTSQTLTPEDEQNSDLQRLDIYTADFIATIKGYDLDGIRREIKRKALDMIAVDEEQILSVQVLRPQHNLN